LVAVALAGGLATAGESARIKGPDRFRRLAPGVLTTIAPDLQPDETHSTHDVVELHTREELNWTPHLTPKNQTLFARSQGTQFRRPIWCLQFSFKPLRMIRVDLPQPSGKMQRKLVWYLVYRVVNTGERLLPSEKGDDGLAPQPSDGPIRFEPQFVLESQETHKQYLDRLIPAAIGPIRRREDPRRRLLTSVEMAQHPIPVSTEREDRGVWGVAMWIDVDPTIDFFSVYIQGLSNAYRWTDKVGAGAYKPGDPLGKGRKFFHKTLQLNFWRPGDAYQEHEEEIRFGTPTGNARRYGVEEGVDSTWVYR